MASKSKSRVSDNPLAGRVHLRVGSEKVFFDREALNNIYLLKDLTLIENEQRIDRIIPFFESLFGEEQTRTILTQLEDAHGRVKVETAYKFIQGIGMAAHPKSVSTPTSAPTTRRR